MPVRPKKSLGQHFLRDENIARKIVGSLDLPEEIPVLEVGAGTGVLTKYLFSSGRDVKVMEIDKEAYSHLLEIFPGQEDNILQNDFLKYDLSGIFSKPYAIIGNFPYNISSQIFFRILEQKQDIPQVVCMIQKEVADRLRAGHGSKTYGILSVLLQAFYDIKYLFPVSPSVFYPPPRVQSAVIRLTRNERRDLPCDEQTFRRVVKAGFNQRRKTLRNSLKAAFSTEGLDPEILGLRPEQLDVQQFIDLTVAIESLKSL
jgi:16S rRNA (adenine1518-N6/adenine1519-N6)-dimethyltransferase